MDKSICIEKIFTEVDFYDRFAEVAKEGFSHVEFWSWSTKDLGRVTAELRAHNLSVASISGDQDYSLVCADEREGYLDYLRRSIEAAKALRCPTLVVHSDAIGPDGKISASASHLSDEEKFAAAVETLRLGAKMAREAGCTLVLEALNTNTQPGCYLHDSQTARRIIDQVDSPHVRLLYDIWHMEQMEGNIPATVRALGSRIGYIHIADSCGRHEPGTGNIDFASFKQALSDIGYNGTLGFELTPASDSRNACGTIRAF